METIKGNAVQVGDTLVFHRAKRVTAIDERRGARFATIKTDWLDDSTVIRLDPRQPYRRITESH